MGYFAVASGSQSSGDVDQAPIFATCFRVADKQKSAQTVLSRDLVWQTSIRDRQT